MLRWALQVAYIKILKGEIAFVLSHPRMGNLSTSLQLEHGMSLSWRKRMKKISHHNVALETSVSSKFTGGQYCFMRFCLRLYSMNVLREKILTAQLFIMKFHYIWCSQKTGGCMVSSKNYETVRYLGHHPCSKLVLTIKLCYSWKACYYSYFLDEKLW